ncbi:MAG: GNAT family N-acetyltransferase [Ilumatobacteraceae bacterium]
MADDVSIREARAAELEELTSLAVAAGSPDAASGQLAMVLRDGYLLVALDDGRPVGVAGSLQVGTATFVSDLFVVSAAQGRGHGRRLVDALLHGVDECVVFSSHHPAARHLYESYGMRPLGRLLYLQHGDRRRYVPDGSPLAVDLLAHGWTTVDDDVVMATPGWEWPTGLLEASPGRFWPDGHDHVR